MSASFLLYSYKESCMFDFFKKKKEKTRITDKIWIAETAKWKAIANQKEKDSNSIFIFWFDNSLRQAESFLQQGSLSISDLVMARELHASQLENKHVVFAEHYPLPQKEQELFAKLNLSEIQVWSALDEPLFKQFGSDKIIGMMKQLGMKEENAIEHSMISKAIQNAQEKISKKVLVDQLCTSQQEWMQRNWANN